MTSTVCKACRNLFSTSCKRLTPVAPLVKSPHKFWKNRSPLNKLNICRHFSSSGDRQKVIYKENGETLIRSPYPDVPMCNKSFRDFMFANLDEFKNLDMLVS